MSLSTLPFTTGPATVPDIGLLQYNGCTFSPLFVSNISGRIVKDNANRTTKYIEYTITVDGYATMPDTDPDVSLVVRDLRTLLTAQGGQLIYGGRGFDLIVNAAGNISGFGKSDVAWGPVPELFEFQPLGGGRSAKVVWRVKVCITEIAARRASNNKDIPLLQFNYDTSLNYDEDGFSSISINGTVEIPMTRTPNQRTRTLQITVDNVRSEIERRIMPGIDLSRYHVTHRNFNVTRDKRTMEWSIELAEKPYMDLPPDCTIARGNYSVRPSKSGAGLCNWLCTLRASYIVRADKPKRLAWLAFLALLRVRMRASRLGNIPPPGGDQNPGAGALRALGRAALAGPIVGPGVVGILLWQQLFGAQNRGQVLEKAWLVDFSFDEGMYLDSKTTSFSATWRLVTTFSHILLASGLWRKVPEQNALGGNLWAASMRDISGANSWLVNRLNPDLDVIVDFGS